MLRAFQRTFSVQGLNILDKGQEWDDAANAHTTNIKVVPGEVVGQPTYPVALIIDDEFCGYPPEQIADEIADIMDQSWPIELRVLEANPFNEDWTRTEKVDGEECPRIYATAKVQVYAIPPDPTPKQQETFDSIRQDRLKQHEEWKERYAKWKADEAERVEQAKREYAIQKKRSNRNTAIKVAIASAIVIVFVVLFAVTCAGCAQQPKEWTPSELETYGQSKAEGESENGIVLEGYCVNFPDLYEYTDKTQVYIADSPSDNLRHAMMCMFNQLDTSEIHALKSGDEVTIIGTLEFGPVPFMENCKVKD